MNIAEYTGYFHDGILIDINCQEKNITLTLESSEIIRNDLPLQLKFSEESTLRGKLHLYNISKALINGKPTNNHISMEYQEGDILNLKIFPHKIFLLIEWRDPSIDFLENCVSKIEIEAEKITWENLPNLEVN